VHRKPHVQLEHFFAKYGVRLPDNWTQKIIGVYKQNLHHYYATQSLNDIFMDRLSGQKSRVSCALLCWWYQPMSSLAEWL